MSPHWYYGLPAMLQNAMMLETANVELQHLRQAQIQPYVLVESVQTRGTKFQQIFDVMMIDPQTLDQTGHGRSVDVLHRHVL